MLTLAQILINLTSNSIKFTNKGCIEIKLENFLTYGEGIIIRNDTSDQALLVKIKEKNSLKQLLKISVIDTGKGISDEYAEMFNSDVSFKNALNFIKKDNSQENIMGTGYGLDIVKILCSKI